MRFSSFTYLVGQGLHNMRANRLMTLASMGVLTVCMILVGAAYLLGVKVDAVVGYIGSQNESYFIINDEATDEQVTALGDQIAAVSGVSSVVYISREETLSQWDSLLGSYTDLYADLQADNPLPQMYRVAVSDVSQMESIMTQIQSMDYVDGVNAAVNLADTFVSLQRVISYICIGLVGVLALVSIVVISNTIRITVFARRKEIAIMKLVGATNGFIRFPFFVEGTTSGLISAAISSGVVCGAYYALCRWYTENPSTFSQMFGGQLVPLSSVWYYIVIGFVLLGFVLCGIGTATSIRKHLNV